MLAPHERSRARDRDRAPHLARRPRWHGSARAWYPRRVGSPDALAHADALAGVLAAHDAEGARWVQSAVAGLPEPVTEASLRIAFARAGRTLGDAVVDPTSADLDRLGAAGASMPGPWRLRDLGRAIVLLHVLSRLPDDRHVALVAGLVRRGEIGEQCTMLRILPALPEPGRFADVAIDACRTNAEPVFASIAAFNPFPAAFFPAAAFDQMVLKAVFIGLPVDRIVGLKDRVTKTTGRMAADYASERRAAGRPVPPDIDWILALTEALP